MTASPTSVSPGCPRKEIKLPYHILLHGMRSELHSSVSSEEHQALCMVAITRPIVTLQLSGRGWVPLERCSRDCTAPDAFRTRQVQRLSINNELSAWASRTNFLSNILGFGEVAASQDYCGAILSQARGCLPAQMQGREIWYNSEASKVDCRQERVWPGLLPYAKLGKSLDKIKVEVRSDAVQVFTWCTANAGTVWLTSLYHCSSRSPARIVLADVAAPCPLLQTWPWRHNAQTRSVVFLRAQSAGSDDEILLRRLTSKGDGGTNSIVPDNGGAAQQGVEGVEMGNAHKCPMVQVTRASRGVHLGSICGPDNNTCPFHPSGRKQNAAGRKSCAAKVFFSYHLEHQPARPAPPTEGHSHWKAAGQIKSPPCPGLHTSV